MAKYKTSNLFDIIIKRKSANNGLEMSKFEITKEIILKINKRKFLGKSFERKLGCLSFIARDNITDHKVTVVLEEHWPADYLKAIYYGKERPIDSFFV